MNQSIVKTFLELVKIDSPSGNEEGVADYLIKRLKKVTREISVDKQGNILAKLPGVGEPLLLSAHMDTVEPGKNIKPVVVNKTIKSDGTTILGADNKAAIAAILQAIIVSDKNKRRSLEIVFSVREETDGGINFFNFNKIKSKSGLVADSSSPLGTIVYTSPWIANLYVTISGKAVHSGSPEKGVNALTACANAIAKIRWGRIDKYTTANIGYINGGAVTNSIPGEVKLGGEVRSFSKKSLDKYLEVVKQVFEKESLKIKAKAFFEIENYCSGYVYKKSDAAIKQMLAVCNKLKIAPVFKMSFGGSDANTFIQNGISAVNIGDGSQNAHEFGEQIEIKELVKLSDFILKYIEG